MPDDRFIHRKAGHGRKPNLLTDLEHRVWFQYMLSADDFGVMRATHHQIQADNDHLANRPAKVILRCLDALVKVGLIRRFEHQGKPYVYQHDWQTWQKVSYPRTTTQPCPPADALADCDAATQALFRLHPGGAGKKRGEQSGKVPQPFREDSENVPEMVSEHSPLTRAGAPAKRLTANGTRLTANGSEGGPGETPPMDDWFERLKSVYPPQRVTSGHLTMTAFVDALLKAPEGPEPAFGRMLSNLANQKRGHEWRVKGMIPKLENWLRSGAWEQQHDEAPPSTLVNDKSARVLTSGAAFVSGEDRGPR